MFENYRDDTYKLEDFLKKEFPNGKFIWDEDSKGWWTEDEDILNKYSSERVSSNDSDLTELQRKFSIKNRGFKKLIINDDFDRIQFTLD